VFLVALAVFIYGLATSDTKKMLMAGGILVVGEFLIWRIGFDYYWYDDRDVNNWWWPWL
jgi:hypothetical protein